MDTIQNGYLARYLDQNMTLARTLVIKSKEAAALMNEGIAATYGLSEIDLSAPQTWKYYLNLSGQYHPTDTLMTVVSIDTLEQIDFTTENLAIHTATAEAHRYGTRHYHALVARYPSQELLINGILTPADIQIAIAAENGTILTYPKDLVESNETTLLLDLEAYVKKQYARWFNVQFAMSDNLYVAVFLAALAEFILPKLLNLRLARCKTNEAHSFHVRMYLASHGELDRYLPYMTLKQSLWLYRNICYIERNPGKVRQLARLIQHLLTERGIPIGEYSVRQLDSYQGYTPELIARLKLLNVDQNSLTLDYHDLPLLYDKELPEAPGNERYFQTYAERDTERFATANSAVTQTKVLHSSMVDYSDAVPEPFEMVSIRQWAYMANNGLYDVVINFKDPRTSETRTLFAKDAFFYMYYVSLMAEGITVPTVPEYLNMQQRRHPKPSLADLLKVVPTKEHDLAAIAQQVWKRQPNITPCYSVTAFNKLAQTLTDEAYWHWFLISSTEDLYERALVENLIKALYEDVRMSLDITPTDTEAWLAQNSLPVYDLSYKEAQDLIKSIYEASTGRTVDNTKILKNIQRAMIAVTKQLSSYSIQFTHEINDSRILPINWPAVRFGNQKASQADHRVVEAGSIILDSSEHGGATAEVGITKDLWLAPYPAAMQHYRTVVMDPSVDQINHAVLAVSVSDPAPVHTVSITYPGQDEALEEAMGLPGYTSFERLPESARLSLKSHY